MPGAPPPPQASSERPRNGSSPDAALVRLELQRILESPQFSQADRLSGFLRFIVEAALHGEAGTLKETLIGVEVYHRQLGYDPKTDPIVRTEARRLRQKLEQCYETAGSDHRVIIELPKGGYVPQFLAGPEPPPTLPARTELQPAERRRAAMAIAAATLAIFLAAAWYVAAKMRGPRLLPQVTSLTSYVGFEFEPSLSPDGKDLAFVWSGNSGNYDIYVKRAGQETPLRLTADPAQDVCPAWSPDGRSLAFLRLLPAKAEVLVIPASGGAERRIGEIAPRQLTWIQDASLIQRCAGPAWSPDGNRLAVADRSGDSGPDALYLLAADGGGRVKATAPGEASLGDLLPAFSPDGRKLAYVRVANRRGGTDIYVQPAAGGAAERVTRDAKAVTGLTWCGGRMVFASNRTGSETLWMLAPGGDPSPLPAAGRKASEVSCSQAGDGLAFTETFRNTNVWRVALDSTAGHAGAPERVLASSGKNDSAQYSPDGSRIAFISDRSGYREIWTANADGSNLAQLTSFSGTAVGTPRWSPGGTEIAFDGLHEGHSAIYRIAANGGKPVLIAAGQWDDLMPSWSRDGRSIYFAANAQGRLQVFKAPAAGGQAVPVTRGIGGEAQESADGKTVYYEHGNSGIWEVPAGGGEEKPVPGLGAIPEARYWAVTGNGIYYLTSQKSPWVIAFYNFATGLSSPVFTMANPPIFRTPSLAVSHDGRWLLYTQLDQSGSDVMELRNFR